ncbi:type II toxin-antitoxin system PemK/MazF family toxin [Laspinema olomoucense]|uniref:type II toxin-antitoxin system PemK/MazF family toxin n=1 Tax=Laspinema olomoucense TaxID=3231600 RepID=UPI00338F79BA
MNQLKLEAGDIIAVDFPPTCEANLPGFKPIVGPHPALILRRDGDLLTVLPISRTQRRWAVALDPSDSPLRHSSWVLFSQIRSIPRNQVKRCYGKLSRETFLKTLDSFVGWMRESK